MAPRKPGREFARTVKNLDITEKIVKIRKNPGSKGRTKDLSKKRCLNGLYNKRNGLKIGLV